MRRDPEWVKKPVRTHSKCRFYNCSVSLPFPVFLESASLSILLLSGGCHGGKNMDTRVRELQVLILALSLYHLCDLTKVT